MPERLADRFMMKKAEGVNTHVAVCEVWTNRDGWELRLTRDGQGRPIRETVVRSADEMGALVERWRDALLKIGWEINAHQRRREPMTV